MAIEGEAQAGSSDGAAPVKAPRLGVLLNFQARRDLGEAWETAYREGLELAAECSRVGVDDIWISEHHGEEDGYCPSPIVAGAAVASLAPRCKVGQGVALAPLYGNPLRLAEDLATLDNLTGGRMEMGFGQGYRKEEYDSYGLPFKGRTRAFEEILEILTIAWKGERFSYDGRVYRLENALLRPGPVNGPALPLWIGAAAPVSRARAVRFGAGLMIANLTELRHSARQFEAFDEEARLQGSMPLRHALSREILVGDSAAEAIARHQSYLDFTYRVQYPPERTGLTYKDPHTGVRTPLTSDHPYYLSEAYMKDRWFIGPAEEVANAIVAWQVKLNLDILFFHPKMPGMPLKQAVSELARVAGEVMPLVRAKCATTSPRRGLP